MPHCCSHTASAGSPHRPAAESTHGQRAGKLRARTAPVTGSAAGGAPLALPRRLFVLTLAAAGLRCTAASGWPGCQEKDTVIRMAGQPCFEDLQSFGVKAGCFEDDCSNTDKFKATKVESCAYVCKSLELCQWWTYGEQDGMKKCFLRVGDAGRETADGWVSGAKECAPDNAAEIVNDEL
uniref:Apple domain-containing protein n=1 Tax=Alexandrium monilatum TaxID=311494 RepID=A0A6T1H7Q6_9DINO